MLLLLLDGSVKIDEKIERSIVGGEELKYFVCSEVVRKFFKLYMQND